MSQLSVLFEVPQTIIYGLATGGLERVGGVIREVDTKQVVAWLRETPSLDMRSSTTNALQSALASSNVIGMAGHVLSFSMSAASFWVMMQRLNELSSQLEAIHQSLKREFQRDRDNQFSAALEAARDVFDSPDASIYRDNAARSAIDGLSLARKNFLQDFEALAKDGFTAQERPLAQHALYRALTAEYSRIRCYMTSSVETARKRLSEELPRLQDAIQRLTRSWLGDHPAIYFHRDVPLPTLERFLAVRR